MWRGVWPGIAEEEAPIKASTNGVHLPTWVTATMAQRYARHIDRNWDTLWDAQTWSRAAGMPAQELWQARSDMRHALVQQVRRVLSHQLARRGVDAAQAARTLDPNALTIIFARRFATYKRANLLLTEPGRLLELMRRYNVQFVFAGKAHPKDEPGKELLKSIFDFSAQAEIRERFVFVEEYDLALARYLVSGADVWLNLPRRPYEASGTSGMKAAANGALNLSIPDGWWAEAWDEHNRLPDPIGWSISAPHVGEGQDRSDADALYTLLETDVLPLFFDRNEQGVPEKWCARVKASIQQVVPYFNTHRMVQDYVEVAYIPAKRFALNGSIAPAV
jgi:starch phosphorylase